MGKDSAHRQRKKAVPGRNARRSLQNVHAGDAPTSIGTPAWLQGLRDRVVAQIPDLIGPDGHPQLSQDDKDALEKVVRVLKAFGHAAIEQFGDWLQEVGRKQARPQANPPEPVQNEELRRLFDALREAVARSALEQRTGEEQPSEPERGKNGP